MTIVVTNPKCQIKQQSRPALIIEDRKTVFYILLQNKNEDDMNEYDKNNGKIVSLSLDITKNT